MLEPIFDYMKNPMKIEFDDDIIDICYYIMNNTNKIPKIAPKTIPKITRVFVVAYFFIFLIKIFS